MKLHDFLNALEELYKENRITKNTADTMNLYAHRFTEPDDLEEVLDSTHFK